MPVEPALDFEHADIPSGALSMNCAGCQRVIRATYYGLNGRNLCPDCCTQLQAGRDQGSFAAALLYGAAAAVLGALAYYAIVALTNAEFGLIAIFVGLFIGKAVRKGAGLRAGRRYRALAIALAYVSVTATYLPAVLKGGGAHSWIDASLLALVLPTLMLARLHNLVGLAILAIGVYEAWKHSAAPKLNLQGPFTLQAATPAPAVSVQGTSAAQLSTESA